MTMQANYGNSQRADMWHTSRSRRRTAIRRRYNFPSDSRVEESHLAVNLFIIVSFAILTIVMAGAFRP